ncbi:MAG: helix-turn-helix domain-containing protein, partial [Candidatus Aminicenantes bacterium]|nr:helix-turn-helix domain-containing protein [Candidatus Aminicenantes bacterium]
SISKSLMYSFYIHGLTLKDVARRLGVRSLNTYARYEQGRAVPTVETFDRLLTALSDDEDYVLIQSRILSSDSG